MNLDEVPARPEANRPEAIPESFDGWSMNAPNGQVHMNVGFGFFPSLFSLQFQSFAFLGPTLSEQNAFSNVITEQQWILERLLFGLGSLIVICLIIW